MKISNRKKCPGNNNPGKNAPELETHATEKKRHSPPPLLPPTLFSSRRNKAFSNISFSKLSVFVVHRSSLKYYVKIFCLPLPFAPLTKNLDVYTNLRKLLKLMIIETSSALRKFLLS